MTDRLLSHRFHGRRKGKTLTDYRQGLLEHDFNHYKATIPFETQKNSWLEIGFGNGEFLSHMSQNNPDINFIGCEPFINGVAALLSSIEKPVDNLKIWSDDARLLIDEMPDQSMERVYLLNPDPWPKSRHHKRRFVQEKTLNMLSRILKKGGLFIMSSDHHELVTWMFDHTNAHDNFEWTGLSGDDWLTPPSDWPIDQTRYMKKGLAGKDIYWLIFKRK
ncbi:MAG: tRNA (guanosine(46)-N7)-methyltransferase TrmB [Alphaproteobacteria bacterium]|nr:MAG: tRNA (guanosine(46)-N7)-methyltransferase TrmB [Alphaproteobacteria bacterium]